jgi:23S rRNA (cytidine1920-2'-O)/16S rRNA (cytidine1409-2'-O)-methyltransferase
MAGASFRPLRKRLQRERPDVDADAVIRDGRVRVDGTYVTNPSASVPARATIVVEEPAELRGRVKLGYALDRCEVPVVGAVALDVGAAAGGFTTALLERGAARVYAVDAGHGQLLGSLRQDPRVVNLEATNIGRISRALVPDPIAIVSVDVSYLTLREAVVQLAPLRFADAGTHLVGLVKPMFELGLGELPATEEEAASAVEVAAAGIAEAGWRVLDTFASAVRGRRGASEYFVHATLDRFAEVPARP